MGNHFKPDLVCSFCGPIGTEYRIKYKGTDVNGDPLHQCCYCNKCGNYIKNLSKTNKYGTKEQQSQIWEKTKGRCCYCGTVLNPFKKRGYSYEHIVPQIKGGGHETGNLYMCCISCNSQKGGKSLEEYREYIKQKENKGKHLFHFEADGINALGDFLKKMF